MVDDQQQISLVMDRLLAVGQTSGEDAVSGFLLGAQRLVP
jgi:hypothetical protein